MCGIAGIIHPGSVAKEHRADVKRMGHVQTHRGPDGIDSWDDQCCYFSHNRLSILDLTAHAHQPMLSADGRYVLVYNGEIYNYQHLRTGLEAKGYAFRSTGDTEVLLYWLCEHGIAGVKDLYGIFAFALWDRTRKRLVAARDPFGVKPFHFALDADRFVFASEIKALAAAGVPIQFDPTTLEELLVFRFTAGARTPFKGIKRLLPGEVLVWEEGRIEKKRYWTPTDDLTSLDPTMVQDYGVAFDEIVRMERIADVPVGVLLSGGLDSSAVAASLASQEGDDILAFHVSFEDEQFDERPEAEDVARQWGLTMHSTHVPDDRIGTLFREAQRVHDEPLAHANDAYILEIARLAKQHVKVLLSGEGADETLGGYVRYRPLLLGSTLDWGARLGMHRWPRVLRMWNGHRFLERLDKLGRFLQRGGTETLGFFNAAHILPWELTATLRLDVEDEFHYRRETWALLSESGVDLTRRTMIYDQMTFLCSILDRNDRMTMGASIECRVPFLAPKLAAIAQGIPTRALFNKHGGKRPLRLAFSDRLPTSVLTKRKRGFEVPWKHYLVADLVCAAVLERIRHDGMAWTERLKQGSIDPCFQAYKQGDIPGYFIVLQLFFLQLWAEECLEPLMNISRQARAERGSSEHVRFTN